MALCPELDVASQGKTVEEARENLREAVELFLECADPSEIELAPGHARAAVGDGKDDAGLAPSRADLDRLL
ncbi:MAG TPA: type II toxin-antitoxin system HicB family antitoxin [Thermoanaerobaculia bacterium]